MNWVEKSSIEKIHRFLEISERERHCQVLLTPENISVMRHNPTPYTLPVIPRPLPSHVVEREHFVIVDLRRLVSGSASSSRNPVIEASSRVQGAGSTSRSSASSSGGFSSSPPAPSQRTRSTLVQITGPSQLAVDGQLAADGSSGDQEIIIPCSPELGLTGRTEPGGADRSESN